MLTQELVSIPFGTDAVSLASRNMRRASTLVRAKEIKSDAHWAKLCLMQLQNWKLLLAKNFAQSTTDLREALVNMAITSPLPLDLTIDATADGPCELSGPGVTIAVSDGT